MGKFSELDIERHSEEEEALFCESWARVELLNRGEAIVKLGDLTKLKDQVLYWIDRAKYYEEPPTQDMLNKIHEILYFIIATAEEPFE